MKFAIYGYRTEIKDNKHNEGYVIFSKRIFQSWNEALEDSLFYLTKKQEFEKAPIITWFYKL